MKIDRRRALVAIASAFAIGCARRSSHPSLASRVVSISPSTTEAVFAIGAGETLVGRSRFCDYPNAALALPTVGGFSDPNVEAILALHPSLVVGAHGPAGPALESTLAAHDVATYFPRTESIAEIEAMITGLGEKLGRKNEARSVNEGIETKRRAVEKAVAGRPRKKVILLFDVAPIVASGPGGFPNELLTIAGGDNVITSGGEYPAIDLERLVALDPEVILDGASYDAGEPRVMKLAGKPGWRELSAIKTGRVVPLPLDTVLRPGPRIGDGLMAIARAIFGADLAIEVK